MAERYASQKGPDIRPNRRCPPEQEINILLLGPTGVGKSTFINAFANCLVNDTLEKAVNDEIQVIIPSFFSLSTSDTFEKTTITLGNENEYEKFDEMDLPSTRHCRTYVFPIGDRNLRFIDTPGIGNNRYLEQHIKNFHEILTYIAQYDHLNAVCILFKSNEERLNIPFRYYVKEILRYLHISVSENIMFVFTHTRTTFYRPGSTVPLLRQLLRDFREKSPVEIPFSKEKTFLLDNESFRYLGLRKNGIQPDDDELKNYYRSWDYSYKEYGRLLAYIITRPIHTIRQTFSLNEAEQLIRKLSRPIAETIKLIEENIHLSEQHKTDVLTNIAIALHGIPQNTAVVLPLQHPRTRCTGANCCRVIEINNEQKVEYTSICHEECYLIPMEQEFINNITIKSCEVMNWKKDNCGVCGCMWQQHQHITYELITNRIHLQSNATTSSAINQEVFLSDIDQRISNLREEEIEIQHVYKKLWKFLYENTIPSISNDIIEYLRLFIREEQMKQKMDIQNAIVIANLEDIITDFTSEMELCKKASAKWDESSNIEDRLTLEQSFPLVSSLYKLPVTGQTIREQVNGIELSQEKVFKQRDIFVRLPTKAASSKLMCELKNIMTAR